MCIAAEDTLAGRLVRNSLSILPGGSKINDKLRSFDRRTNPWHPERFRALDKKNARAAAAQAAGWAAAGQQGQLKIPPSQRGVGSWNKTLGGG